MSQIYPLKFTLIPTGYIFCLMAMDCWGRRPILSFCQAISGLACIAAGLLFPLTETNPGIGGLQVHRSILCNGKNYRILLIMTEL